MVSSKNCGVASTSGRRLGLESHTFEHPSCHSQRKGRAAISTAEALPLVAVCLTALSAMTADLMDDGDSQRYKSINEEPDGTLGLTIGGDVKQSSVKRTVPKPKAW